MRWRDKANPSVGTARRVVKFALLPITIKSEHRWLEYVAIKEVFQSAGARYVDGYWKEICFDDDWLSQWHEVKKWAKR